MDEGGSIWGAVVEKKREDIFFYIEKNREVRKMEEKQGILEEKRWRFFLREKQRKLRRGRINKGVDGKLRAGGSWW